MTSKQPRRAATASCRYWIGYWVQLTIPQRPRIVVDSVASDDPVPQLSTRLRPLQRDRVWTQALASDIEGRTGRG